MKAARSPFDRAHIALQGPNVDEALRSGQSLHNALAWGVEMIRDEVLLLIGGEA